MPDDKRILIVEDEEKIARILKLELEYEGYQTETAHEGITAWELLQSQSWALVILDVMLPGLSGMELLRRMRDRKDQTPVIMLTARDNVVDKVSGLDQGANDYVTKPFEIEELLARIRANLRQLPSSQQKEDESLLNIADLEVHTASREVTRAGLEVTLTAREYDLLVFLLHNPNQVLTRDQLLQHVWGFDYIGDTNIVDVYIRYLRQKMDKDFEPKLLHTVRGAGYMLKDRRS
ncbi:response regulator transcription factor [Alkalicoccobacillus plakortidis]|uniref:Response regulator transcription factor n=1 Tax=Alkalicoccobacillus plakortidis TaxID=444060 RepID=A0ABT0XIH0_9BACI|nr:response regulator transcription factor [Alkalicoccobacillus plakortidis]MCM2674999.1 response regulator transcription factor [Alkalicoccobacillus plakortidis]